MAFLNCNRDSLSALKEVDLKVGRRGGAWEREWVSAETRHSSDCVSTRQAVWKPQSHSLSHQTYSFLLSSQAFVADVPGQNPQLLLISVLVPWAQTMKLLKSARGEEKERKRPGNSDVLKRTMCEFVWCGMICQRRPNSLYDGHAKLVDTGLCFYVRASQSRKNTGKPQPVRPCLDPAGLSILK